MNYTNKLILLFAVTVVATSITKTAEDKETVRTHFDQPFPRKPAVVYFGESIRNFFQQRQQAFSSSNERQMLETISSSMLGTEMPYNINEEE